MLRLFHVHLSKHQRAIQRHTTIWAEASDDLIKIVDQEEPGWTLEWAEPVKEQR